MINKNVELLLIPESDEIETPQTDRNEPKDSTEVDDIGDFLCSQIGSLWIQIKGMISSKS